MTLEQYLSTWRLFMVKTQNNKIYSVPSPEVSIGDPIMGSKVTEILEIIDFQ